MLRVPIIFVVVVSCWIAHTNTRLSTYLSLHYKDGSTTGGNAIKQTCLSCNCFN